MKSGYVTFEARPYALETTLELLNVLLNAYLHFQMHSSLSNAFTLLNLEQKCTSTLLCSGKLNLQNFRVQRKQKTNFGFYLKIFAILITRGAKVGISKVNYKAHRRRRQWPEEELVIRNVRAQWPRVIDVVEAVKVSTQRLSAYCLLPSAPNRNNLDTLRIFNLL